MSEYGLLDSAVYIECCGTSCTNSHLPDIPDDYDKGI